MPASTPLLNLKVRPRARLRRPAADRAFLIGAAAVALLVVLPILALAEIGLSGTAENWEHLANTILPEAARTTFLLMAGIGTLAGSIGVATAWLVSGYEFPGRGVFAWALVLPLAVPTYIAAFCFLEFFTYVGPVQTALRAVMGYETSRDYWFPDIRSLWGAVVVLSLVLYPYIYLTVRMIFMMQGRKAADVARTLGASEARVFWRVILPMARPAIAVGVTLALMEAVNDIGAVEFLGVRTLTFAVYATWLNRGDLAGAAQIALMMLAIVVLLVALERFARRRQHFTAHRGDRMRPRLARLAGGKAALAFTVCFLPILLGFGVPLYVLGDFALPRLDQLADPVLWDALRHTVIIAGATGLVTVAAGFFLAFGIRLTRSRPLAALVRLGALGYAVPGTVIAIGVLIPLANFDNAVDAFMRANFGISTGLLISGTGAAIVYACFVRFMAMGYGAVESGFTKLSPHVDLVARTLGRSPGQTLKAVILPLMRPALLTAFLLVFVDTVKELSATILLRPFDFNTLATFVYQNASRAAYEDAAIASLLIVLTGMIPVALLTRSIMGPAGPDTDRQSER